MHDWVALGYLTGAVLFVLGLMGLSHPRRAVAGNGLGALGMLLCVVVTLLDRGMVHWWGVVFGLLVGSAAGVLLAQKVAMTAMPQMVGLFNGLGGAASALVAWAELHQAALPMALTFRLAAGLSVLIGAVTLSGSLVAAAKLHGLMGERPWRLPHEQLLKALVLVVALVLVGAFALQANPAGLVLPLVAVALVLGVQITVAIGGADMPVVIALMNAYSGLAGAAAGFVLANSALVIAGALVGASGLILTQIMCRAMNRSMGRVLLGGFGEPQAAADADAVYGGRIKATSAEEVALLLDGVQQVMVVPGYGLAVAQAQYALRDLVHFLEGRGIQVTFAIHPVAGRMPGHMNVLLAEVDIPYEQLLELDAANAQLPRVDVAIVIGANDVVNPSAQDPSSPIAGMPIVAVNQAQTVVVIKRSLSPGFAGIPNPLFAMDNTLMFFADAKEGLGAILAALKAG